MKKTGQKRRKLRPVSQSFRLNKQLNFGLNLPKKKVVIDQSKSSFNTDILSQQTNTKTSFGVTQDNFKNELNVKSEQDEVVVNKSENKKKKTINLVEDNSSSIEHETDETT